MTIALLVSIHPALVLLAVFALPTVLTSTWRPGGRARGAGARRAVAAAWRAICSRLATTAPPGKEVRVTGIGERLVDRAPRGLGALVRAGAAARWGSAVWHTLAWAVFGGAYVGAVVFVVVGLRASGRATCCWCSRPARGCPRTSARPSEQRTERSAAEAWSRGAVAGGAGRGSAPAGGRRRSWPTASRGARSTPPSTGPGWTHSVSSLKPMTRDNSIVVEKLVRQFKKGPRAVDGIDLHVAPGEIYGFLGPNGAGKSTTVLMLTTLLPPTDGTALVGGYDVRTEGPKVRSVIGAALQEAALDPLLTGRDHLRLQTMLQAIPRAERKARQNELLDRVGLTEAADRKVGGYSGGMKRRLDLALALVHRPSILFLDEPTTGLDPQSRTALWEEVARLAREDKRHRLPDDAVPRGGGRARRPGRDHRPRQDRRRGHAGRAEGRDRPCPAST